MEAVLTYLEDLDLESPVSSFSPEKQKKVHNLVQQALKKDDLRSKSVPPDILRYAVLANVFPEYDVSKTKLILALLTSLEAQRKVHLDYLEGEHPSLLQPDASQLANDEGGLLPSPELKKHIFEMKEFDSDMHEMFLRIVETATCYHAYDTWLNHSLPDFWERFNYYFPALSGTGSPRCIFYKMMSPAEDQRLKSAGMSCLHAITEGFAIAKELNATSELSVNDILKSDEFSTIHTPDFVTRAGGLQAVIKAYVNTICDDHRIIQKLMGY
ncbi:hypothetical protein CC1G_02003 [Coprinopsis cinerea okayama7|uniref:Uncharacterized protein n=1 Tax=Coprinopsis cinerea (strain Okayama-7 / 130 / ATCC MYA-4618 / FGSC 9003) TaxID=240176 RepID=A8N695_COPC7|nr:hypothetical protein CC1G_02003 [Coprinopsis cinerea okayama7\|eukprot:XP_001830367.1 hypothetical protein CC1G_02003 [Coprinopsis cinerea okayama7\